jgi:cytochrome c biogenesis protein CcmG/thiol:disulfide interchange protein DsbE
MRFLWTLLICAAGLAAEDLNRPMQRFLLPDTTGHDHDSNEWKGKPMVLEFMATACPHCIAFTSVLKQVQEKYRDRVVIIAMVNPPVTAAQAAQFIKEYKITYPILLDAGRAAYAYIRKPAFDLPYIFLIDANGMIREAFEYGPTTADLFSGTALLSHVDGLFGAAAAQPKK